MKLSALGEFGLIGLLARDAPLDSRVRTAIGDDTAVVETVSGRDLLLTCDMLAEGVHFHRHWYESCPEFLGRKALAVNVSDISGMGGEPRYCLITLGIPRDADPGFVRRVYDGLYSLARECGVSVVGGDTVGFGGGMLLDVFLVGEVERGRALLRSGARPGDLMVVTGECGLARAGLAVLQGRGPGQAPCAGGPGSSGGTGSPGGRGGTGSPGGEAELAAVAKLLSPPTRLVESRALSATGLVHAMSDTSDGLAAQVRLVCEASGIGAVVEAAKVPIAPAVQEVAGLYGGNALHWALYGGEDYELIAAVDPADLDRIRMAVGDAGRLFPCSPAPLAVVGRFTSGAAILLEEQGGRLEPLGQAEWQHF